MPHATSMPWRLIVRTASRTGTIMLCSFDMARRAAGSGVSIPQITVKQVDGGSRYDPRAGSDIEVDLDLQIVLGLVPGAHIIDYQGADGSNGTAPPSLGHSLADIYNQIEQDGLAQPWRGRVWLTSASSEGCLGGARPSGSHAIVDPLALT